MAPGEMTLGGLRTLDLEAPVCHVSYYEADAYARWAGARLPAKPSGKWRQPTSRCVAASRKAITCNRSLRLPVRYPQQLFGDVWGGPPAPTCLPGFRPLEGSLGEYNGKVHVWTMVLRGGCCAAPESHVRVTTATSSSRRCAGSSPGCAWPGALNMALAIHFHDQLQQPHEPRCATRPGRVRRHAQMGVAENNYDRRGSEAVRADLSAAGYYITRTEEQILAEAANDILDRRPSQRSDPNWAAAPSLGSPPAGSAAPTSYTGIDISEDFLLSSTQRLAADYPWLEVHAACTDFSHELNLPDDFSSEHPLVFFQARASATSHPPRPRHSCSACTMCCRPAAVW